MPWAAIGSAIGNAYGQYQQNKVQNSQAIKQGEKNFWWNFWAQNYFMDKQNEYNKPVNQMKRLAEAGLNPNLVYENGATTVSAGPQGGANVAAPISRSKYTIDALEKTAILKQMQQKEAEIDYTRANTGAINANIDIKRAELELAREFNTARINALNATIASTLASTRAKDADLPEKRARSEIWNAILNAFRPNNEIPQLW